MIKDFLQGIVVGWALSSAFAFAQANPECGKGPHKITILVPTDCACSTQLNSMGAGLYYAAQICPADTSKCNSVVDQTWSDWPECKGTPTTGVQATKPTLKDEKRVVDEPKD